MAGRSRAWASSCCCVGFAIVAVDRQRSARCSSSAVRVPLDPRARRAHAGSTRLPSRRAGDARRRVAGRHRGCAATPRRAAEADSYPRAKFLEVTTLGLGAVIGGLDHRAGARLHDRARRSSTRAQDDHDLGPLDRLSPRASASIATFPANPRQGDVSRRTAFVRYNGLLEGAAELHDPLEPLRRTSAARCSRTARSEDREDRRYRRRDADPDAAVRLRLPVPRRPVRQRGQPHRRPARARARPLRVLDPQRQPLPRQAVLGLATSRAPARRREIYKWTLAVPGRARRRASSPGSTRSSRRS